TRLSLRCVPGGEYSGGNQEPGLPPDLPGLRPDTDRQGSGQGPQENRGPAHARTQSPDTRERGMSRVVIVGAGISGLAIAFRLQQAIPSCDITILEQAQRPGGAVWTERQEGFQIEFGPNGFLDSKSSTIALCRDLGIADRLIPASEAAGRNRYLFFN